MAGERNLKDIVERRMEFFRRKPEAALYRPRASSRHIRDLYTETTVREHTVKVDYAEAAGGSNLAPNPIELLLASLAACIESAFYEFAVHRGFTVNALSVDVEGTIDLRGMFMVAEVPSGFRELVYTFTIDSPDDPGKLRALAGDVIRCCPVVDTLTRGVPMEGEVVLRGG